MLDREHVPLRSERLIRSDTSSSSAGGANVTGNNLLEQLMQMQAQLLTPAASKAHRLARLRIVALRPDSAA